VLARQVLIDALRRKSLVELGPNHFLEGLAVATATDGRARR
jgi:hypothetical protein